MQGYALTDQFSYPVPKPGQKLAQEPEEQRPEALSPGVRDKYTTGSHSDLVSRVRSLQRGGQPLPDNLRAYFEPRFGCDFSWVRVHSGSQAADAARAVGARAFTVGRDVVFGTGEYSPDTLAGRHLLAHELTHVIQQGFSSDFRGGLQRLPLPEAATEAPAPPRAPGVSPDFTIVLSGLSLVRPAAVVEATIRQALGPLASQAGRVLRLSRSGAGDLTLTFDSGGHESRPCGLLFFGVEGGGDIFVGAHEDLRICCGPIRDYRTDEIDYITQILRVFEPDEPEFGRFVGNTAVHELGHMISQLDHSTAPDNFMITGNLPRGMRTRENMRRFFGGPKSFSSDQIPRLVGAIRLNQFAGGMRMEERRP
jgi:hypothetical protein